ncbi:R3H domain-containing protein 4 isoform X2 [Hemibagrus wyckioides]|uniref:R3H domain-containing protein 4 isoform X2 n=1 Tax=Hemibagrus wyckioides TaxID=337641 RepID=UPI00266D0DC2|nr:R3H domain-containing protein 4 isoform X2 [Hemibagrus wyckioides]
MVVLNSNASNEEHDIILIEERCSSLPSSPAKRVSPAKRKQFFISQAIRNSDLTPKAKGKKSLRRQENTRYLHNLLERDECSKDETEVQETASPTIFTEACTNGNYMEHWSDFMNRSGEEQEKLLALLDEETTRQSNASKASKDQRELNPAFTAQECFQRIDRKLRATLKRKHIPKTTLELLESDLLTFFEAHPQSIYVAKLSNRYVFQTLIVIVVSNGSCVSWRKNSTQCSVSFLTCLFSPVLRDCCFMPFVSTWTSPQPVLTVMEHDRPRSSTSKRGSSLLHHCSRLIWTRGAESRTPSPHCQPNWPV